MSDDANNHICKKCGADADWRIVVGMEDIYACSDHSKELTPRPEDVPDAALIAMDAISERARTFLRHAKEYLKRNPPKRRR